MYQSVQHQSLRKHCMSNRTRQLYEQRRRDFAKLGEDERMVAKRAISTSCREDNREHVNGILNDMDAAERCDNSWEVSRLTRLLSGRRHTRSINPSKDFNGNLLATQDQLLDEWSKFVDAKFASPDADKNRSLECLMLQSSTSSVTRKCTSVSRPYDAAKLQDVTMCRWRHIVGRWRRRRNCSARIPSELVRGMFVMIHKKEPQDDYRNY